VSGQAVATVEQAERILRDCLIGFEEVRLPVTGHCMRPALQEGEVAVLARVRPRFGDVVLVRQREGLRLHRLVWPLRGPRGVWRTKGDRAPRLDAPVGPEQALGTVVGVDGPGGRRRPARSRTRALLSLAAALWARARGGRARTAP
jgi:hypothetical protein